MSKTLITSVLTFALMLALWVGTVSAATKTVIIRVTGMT